MSASQPTPHSGPRCERNRLRLARLNLWSCIASLEGPEYISQERRAEIARHLRGQVKFVEDMQEILDGDWHGN